MLKSFDGIYHYLVRIRGVLPIPENIQLGEQLFPEKSACASKKSVYYFQNNVSYVKQKRWKESEFMKEQGELKVSKASREEVEKLLNQGVYLEIDYLTFSAKY